MDAPPQGHPEPEGAPAPKRVEVLEEDLRKMTIVAAEEAKRAERAERERAELERKLAVFESARVQPVLPPAPPPAPRDKTANQVALEVLGNVFWKLPEDAMKLLNLELPNDNKHKKKVGEIKAFAPGAKRPGMLFYKLKADEQPLSPGGKLHGDIAGHPTQWTNGMDCKVLLGPSGAGKTRKLLELLVRERGYFLVCKDTNDKNAGSKALSSVLNENFLKSSFANVDWTSTPSAHSDDFLRLRRDAVCFVVQCVLVAYASVYKKWEAWIQAQPHSEDRDRQQRFEARHWLFAQLFPETFFGRDVFIDLATELVNQCSPSSIGYFAKPTDIIHCVIDEAQELGRRMQGMFNTSSGNRLSLRPLLSPVLEGVKKVLNRDPIVSGTGLSLVREWKPLASRMAAVDPMENVFTEFGCLSVEQTEKVLKELLYIKGQKRLREAAEWLAGRPRFVATFIENVVAKNTTIDAYLDVYKAQMTEQLPDESDNPRTPFEALRRLGELPGQTLAMGKAELSPYAWMLTDLYGLSVGRKPHRADNALLIELGLAYAQIRPQGLPLAEARPEALLLEAARRHRATLDREKFLLDFIRAAQDSDSAMGERFEYLVSELLVDALFGREGNAALDFEAHGVFNGVPLPAALQGKWERPPWLFGHLAIDGDEDFYPWLTAVLDPRETKRLRVRFPSTACGPDIVIVPRSQDKSRTMLILVQCKFEKAASDTKGALYTVDPSMLHTELRGEDKQHVIPEHAANHAALMQRLANVCVVRVLVHGAAKVQAKTQQLVHKRGAGRDLQLIIDGNITESVFGPGVASELKKLKQ